VAEFHEDSADPLPPVKVIIMFGDNDLTIKVEDRGGGIPHKQTKQLFSYYYTTAKADLYQDM
jgi:pyruvate dehydrogenase kinase 2/3/4